MNQLIDITSYPVAGALPWLMKDETTGRNIVFATDSYAWLGEGYSEGDAINDRTLLGLARCGLQPRIAKGLDQQAERTKKRAEVFTPAWICCKMNNFCDEIWFEGENPFCTLTGDTWEPRPEPIPFRGVKAWQKYVDSRRLEITCGEAPFLVSRYDAATGRVIPLAERVGILDRKLRVVSENTTTEADWLKWAQRAFQSVYGYELQGDSLLIARINLLVTFSDCLTARWGRAATPNELKKIAEIIRWNLWQMEGLSASVPFTERAEPLEPIQLSLFDWRSEPEEPAIPPPQKKGLPARIRNWREKKKTECHFENIQFSGECDMKFDFVIGNPPYNEEMNNNERSNPKYHLLMDAAFEIATVVELITPARFLFNASQTPKAWNRKMKEDCHIKSIFYEPDSAKVFRGTEIRGGG